MSLLLGLLEKRDELLRLRENRLLERERAAREHENALRTYDEDIADLDKAIAALQPNDALLDPVPSPSPESSSQESPIVSLQTVGDDIMVTRQGGSIEYVHPDDLQSEAPTDAERTSVVTDHDRVEPEIPEGFTRWEGGEAPVAEGVPLEIIFRNSVTPVRAYYGVNVLNTYTICSWRHQGESDDIIAFRVIEAPAETPPPPSEPQSQSEGAGERVEQTENPAAQMFGKALAAESEAKEQRKYNPFAIFGAKVDA